MNKRQRKTLRRKMIQKGKRFYAWYSAKMEACIMPSNGQPWGNCIYKRPDGRLVKTTIISKTRNHGCRWNDMKYLGKVLGNGLVTINKAHPEIIIPPPTDTNWRLAMLWSEMYGMRAASIQNLTLTCI